MQALINIVAVTVAVAQPMQPAPSDDPCAIATYDRTVVIASRIVTITEFAVVMASLLRTMVLAAVLIGAVHYKRHAQRILGTNAAMELKMQVGGQDRGCSDTAQIST